MRSVKTIYEWTLNLLSALFAVIVVSLLVARHISPKNDSARDQLQPGMPFLLTDTSWAQNRRTLVMALQVGCQWCEASADFYRDLLHSDVGNVFHPVAILPQAVSESKTFLHSMSIDVQDVRQSDLRKLGIGGTPTLVIVDSRGKVETSWIGQLSPTLENQVFAKLGVQRPTSGATKDNRESVPVSLITGVEFIALQHRQGDVPLVDIDPRPQFRIRHIAGALNIPVAELEARAAHELPIDSTVVVYCGFRPSCQPTSKSESLQTYSFVGQPVQSYCALGQWDLQFLGFKRLRILSDDLIHLRAAGITISEEVPSSVAELSSSEDTKPN